MKLSACLPSAILALALWATPSMSQETGTLITHPSAEIDGRGRDAARQTMEQFIACLVSRNSGRAIALAELPVDSAQYQRIARNMYDNIDDACLSGAGRLSFSENLFRGALFQALYEREFGADGPTAFSPGTASGYRQIYPETLSAQARTAIALESFGECVARADADGARAFLRQLPGSSGEGEVINALRPRFAACIPVDNTIRFSASVLKGAVAEGLYRLSVAARNTMGAAE